jgi:NADH-quinone oxidoreductase subunit L
LTSVYTFRMVFLTFFGEPKPLVEEMSPLPAPGWRMAIPLLVLALLSVVGGFINLPETMGGLPILQNFLHNTLPPPALKPYTLSMEDTFQIIAAATSLFGILVAYVFILRIPQVTARVTHSRFGSLVQRWWYYGLGFDWVDNNLLVAPFVATARFGKDDLVDTIFDGVGWINIQLNGVFSDTQTGLVRTYLLGIVFGAIVAVALVVLL